MHRGGILHRDIENAGLHGLGNVLAETVLKAPEPHQPSSELSNTLPSVVYVQ